MSDLPITERVWLTEIDRMVNSPAWPLLLRWFEEVQVRRVMHSPEPVAAAMEAGAELKGVVAFMLAIENERASAPDGVIDGRRTNGRQPTRQRTAIRQGTAAAGTAAAAQAR